MRTTLDLEKPVLQGLKALQKQQNRSLGRIASELLAEALASRSRAKPPSPTKLVWSSRAMTARVDLADKDAVYRALDRS